MQIRWAMQSAGLLPGCLAGLEFSESASELFLKNVMNHEELGFARAEF
jgi:hypothetical protein